MFDRRELTEDMCSFEMMPVASVHRRVQRAKPLRASWAAMSARSTLGSGVSKASPKRLSPLDMSENSDVCRTYCTFAGITALQLE
jgi:hypothetical protein